MTSPDWHPEHPYNTLPLLPPKGETRLLDRLGPPILYPGRYIIAHKVDCYRLLLDVARNAAREPWIRFIRQAVEETAQWTPAKIAAIRNPLTRFAQTRLMDCPPEAAPLCASRGHCPISSQ